MHNCVCYTTVKRMLVSERALYGGVRNISLGVIDPFSS